MPVDITSPANVRIKWLVRLRQRRHRDAEGVFVVEGERLYTRALRSGLIPEITFVEPDRSIATTGPTVTVDPAALDRASYRQRSQSVIGVFPQLDTSLAALSLPGPRSLLLIAEGIEKPGNLGAMLRTAAAAGADALVALGDTVDVHNPNVLRASTGAIFSVPSVVTTWDQLDPWLATAGIRVLGATPTATRTMWEADLRAAVALVLGAEDSGLSRRALEATEETILIPQAPGAVDSLNVSVAAAILLFEARRQRN
ncbi:MAG TPA: RNA methyltransferase [Acidimicrobiia bacterium]|nr:RNA methyltransferase [Acidimicrobiia bacterium]